MEFLAQGIFFFPLPMDFEESPHERRNSRVSIRDDIFCGIGIFQCPTNDDFQMAVSDWQNDTTLFELVEIANDLPGWSMILDGELMTMVPAPDEIDMEDIVEGESLDLTIRHWGNDCVVTRVNAFPDAGSSAVLGRRQVDEYTEEIDYRITPSITGEVRPSFVLLDEEDTLIGETILKLYVKSLFDLTVFVGAGTTGTPTVGGVYVEGDEIEYEYAPEPCHNELEVSINGEFVDGSGSFFMVEDILLEALSTFIDHPVMVESTTGGSTNRDGLFYVPCTGSLSITATPDEGYRFAGWSGDASGMDNPLIVFPTTALSITANFEEATYTVTVTSSNGGTTDRDGDHVVPHGGSLTITATPADRWSFGEWTGNVGGNTNPLTLTNITDDLSIHAVFEASPGALIWSQMVGSAVCSIPLRSSGKVFIGRDKIIGESTLFCFEADSGTPIWQYPLPDGQLQTSLATMDEKIFFGTEAGAFGTQSPGVQCVDTTTGHLLWETEMTEGFEYAFPVIHEGKVYIGSYGFMNCLDMTTGDLLWKSAIGTLIGVVNPSVSQGRVYVGAGGVRGLNAMTGVEEVTISPTILSVTQSATDSHLFFGSVTRFFYKLPLPTMSTSWVSQQTGVITGAPALGDQGVYCANSSDRLFRFDRATGGVDWSIPIISGQYLSPILSHGYVYFGTSDGRLVCLNKDTGATEWEFAGGSTDHGISPSISHGYVYFADRNTLYCLKAQTDGQGDWIMPRFDARNTGRNDGNFQ